MRETAFDLAYNTMYEDPNLCPEHGTLTVAGAAPVRVRVLQDMAEPVIEFPGTRVTATRKAIALRLLQAEVPTRPARGSTLVYDDIRYRVNNAEDPQNMGYEWLLDVQPEPA